MPRGFPRCRSRHKFHSGCLTPNFRIQPCFNFEKEKQKRSHVNLVKKKNDQFYQHLVYCRRFSSSHSNDHHENAVFVTLLGMGANVGLVAVKAICGYLGHSTSMIADAAHSLSDCVSDIMVYFALKMSARPPSRDFPWGYGKLDSAAAGFVGASLIATGAGIAYHSVDIILYSEPVVPTTIALFGAVASILVKEILYRITLKAGRDANSQATIANAWHHRSDSLTSLVALFGIGFSMFGYPILDPLTGLAISGFIVKVGLEFGSTAANDLLDRTCVEEIEDLEKLFETYCGFKYTNLRLRRMGPYLLGDCILHVDGNMNINEFKDITDKLRINFQQEIPNLKEFYFISNTNIT